MFVTAVNIGKLDIASYILLLATCLSASSRNNALPQQFNFVFSNFYPFDLMSIMSKHLAEQTHNLVFLWSCDMTICIIIQLKHNIAQQNIKYITIYTNMQPE